MAMDLSDLTNVAVQFVLIALIAGAGALALGAFQSTDSVSVNGSAYNVSSNGLTGLLNMTGQLGTIGTITAVAVLIGVVIAAFQFGRSR